MSCGVAMGDCASTSCDDNDGKSGWKVGGHHSLLLQKYIHPRCQTQFCYCMHTSTYTQLYYIHNPLYPLLCIILFKQLFKKCHLNIYDICTYHFKLLVLVDYFLHQVVIKKNSYGQYTEQTCSLYCYLHIILLFLLFILFISMVQ